MELSQKHKVAILATNGFEESELFKPLEILRFAGADVQIVSINADDIRSWNKTNWGKSIAVDLTLENCSPADFDALVLPGGLMNPDTLRTHEDAIDFIKAFAESGKIIAAICHAPWLLIEAGLAKDRELTSYHSIKTDLLNAGALWQNKAVVCDDGIITSRSPDDLAAFCDKLIEEIAEGSHSRHIPPSEEYSQRFLQ